MYMPNIFRAIPDSIMHISESNRTRDQILYKGHLKHELYMYYTQSHEILNESHIIYVMLHKPNAWGKPTPPACHICCIVFQSEVLPVMETQFRNVLYYVISLPMSYTPTLFLKLYFLRKDLLSCPG